MWRWWLNGWEPSLSLTNSCRNRACEALQLSASAVRTMPRLLEGIGFAANISREETARNAHSFVLVATLPTTKVPDYDTVTTMRLMRYRILECLISSPTPTSNPRHRVVKEIANCNAGCHDSWDTPPSRFRHLMNSKSTSRTSIGRLCRNTKLQKSR